MGTDLWYGFCLSVCAWVVVDLFCGRDLFRTQVQSLPMGWYFPDDTSSIGELN